MSQEKVERYKEQKRNRKKIIKKEKRMHILESTLAVLVCVVIVGWAGYSGYSYYQKNKPVSYTEVNMDAFSDYYANMDVE